MNRILHPAALRGGVFAALGVSVVYGLRLPEKDAPFRGSLMAPTLYLVVSKMAKNERKMTKSFS